MIAVFAQASPCCCSQEDEDALQQQASQVVPLKAENKKLRFVHQCQRKAARRQIVLNRSV